VGFLNRAIFALFVLGWISHAHADTFTLTNSLNVTYIASGRTITVHSGAIVQVVETANTAEKMVTFKILRRSDGTVPRTPEAVYSVRKSQFEGAAYQERPTEESTAAAAVRTVDTINRSVNTASTDPTRCDGGRFGSVSWDDSPSRADCEAPPNCRADPLPKGSASRTRFDRWVAEAANEYGIEPGLIKALVQVETSNNPLAENQIEKEAYESGEGLREYRWGKGLGQFGANNSEKYGLDWSAPKPSREQVYTDAYNEPNADGVFPIWSPRGSILAVAKHLREYSDKEYNIRPTEGSPFKVSIATLFQNDGEERARYLSGMHNRGDRPMNSFIEHFRQHRTFPRYYGQSWNLKRATDTRSDLKLLHTQPINRCHVYKIAGLCPPQTGLYQEYQSDFKLAGGEWVIA
jgi:hypothetical protein